MTTTSASDKVHQAHTIYYGAARQVVCTCGYEGRTRYAGSPVTADDDYEAHVRGWDA